MYLQDVWVNFTEAPERGHEVLHFFEWNKTDNINLVEQTPMIKVDKETFDRILNTSDDLPEEMIKLIKGHKGIKKVNNQRVSADFMLIVGDNDTLLFELDGEKFPARKSRLIPRQDRLAIDMMRKQEVMKFQFPDQGYTEDTTALSNEEVIGLTKKEREDKGLLYLMMYEIRNSKNLPKLKYWYSEWSGTALKDVKGLSFEEYHKLFMQELKHGWTKQHKELFDAIMEVRNTGGQKGKV